ncbi:MAG: peptidoglycan bridge formation glycyltransferase FemA/FemB family protein [bacterium]
MEIIEIKDKKIWNSLVGAHPFSQFLQSWEWGEFHKKMGRKVWRFAAGESNELNASIQSSQDGIKRLLAAQIIKYDLPFGQNYLYCPRGAVISQELEIENQKLWNLFFLKMDKMAREEGSIFLRIEPFGGSEIIKSKVCKAKDIQPKNEWLLDLTKSEDQIFKEMRQKTRYNIRLAEKNGIIAISSNDKLSRNEFWRLISNTYSRKEIKTHSKQYYEGILGMAEGIKLWVAQCGGKTVAANILSYFGDSATYMHGGADYERRNLMATYLLQWEAIKDAKIRGYRYYNFGGVKAEQNIKFPTTSRIENNWAGITRFKKGFGGFELNYIGTYEMPVNKLKYFVYKEVNKLKC